MKFAGIAQLAVRLFCNQEVEGSIPSASVLWYGCRMETLRTQLGSGVTVEFGGFNSLPVPAHTVCGVLISIVATFGSTHTNRIPNGWSG